VRTNVGTHPVIAIFDTHEGVTGEVVVILKGSAHVTPWQFVGHVGVDSGMLFIGDPALFLPAKAGESTLFAEHKVTYESMCALDGETQICRLSEDGKLSVLLQSFGGDGHGLSTT
jgi:hypothetical protein